MEKRCQPRRGGLRRRKTAAWRAEVRPEARQLDHEEEENAKGKVEGVVEDGRGRLRSTLRSGGAVGVDWRSPQLKRYYSVLVLVELSSFFTWKGPAKRGAAVASSVASVRAYITLLPSLWL